VQHRQRACGWSSWPLACNVARCNRSRRHRLQHGGCICVTRKYERAQFNGHVNEARFEQQRAKAATNPRVGHSVSERANHSANDWLLIRIDGPQIILNVRQHHPSSTAKHAPCLSQRWSRMLKVLVNQHGHVPAQFTIRNGSASDGAVQKSAIGKRPRARAIACSLMSIPIASTPLSINSATTLPVPQPISATFSRGARMQ